VISAPLERFAALDAWDRRGLLFWGRILSAAEFAKLIAESFYS
jgi:hypothetical protein